MFTSRRFAGWIRPLECRRRQRCTLELPNRSRRQRCGFPNVNRRCPAKRRPPRNAICACRAFDAMLQYPPRSARSGEMVALEWRDVDLNQGLLCVEGSSLERTGGGSERRQTSSRPVVWRATSGDKRLIPNDLRSRRGPLASSRFRLLLPAFWRQLGHDLLTSASSLRCVGGSFHVNCVHE
jgi:hypothetical protein